MKKIVAVIADIHGNLEALESILKDIETQNIEEIICLGDTIDIGPNSKECLDLLIRNNVKSVLGNHEIYLLNGTVFDPSIVGEEKKHYDWVKKSLTSEEVDYLKKSPLYYEINIDYEDSKFNKKIVLCHYLINDEKASYPFELNNLKDDISLWKKYNDENINYFIGHLHSSFDINEVVGIKDDFILDDGTLTNIEIVDSAGCTKDEYTSYSIIEIAKSITFKRRRVKYDREKFINKVMSTDFPDKKNILKLFYGME